MKTLLILLLCLSLTTPCLAIGKDKIGHFVAGFAISFAIGGEQGFWVGTAAGVGKEALDYTDRQHHSAEFGDALATAAGAYLAYCLRPHKQKQGTWSIELLDGTKYRAVTP